MSLFFDYKVNLPDEQAVLCAWSNSEYQPVLAVSTRSGKVLLFSEEGESHSKVQMARSTYPSQLFWHPYLPILFSCWEDGVICY